jgi:hypothetical protein
VVEKEALLQGLTLARDVYEAMYATTSNAYSALKNSIVGVELTQSTLDNYVSQISSDSTKAKANLSAILNSKNQITKL